MQCCWQQDVFSSTCVQKAMAQDLQQVGLCRAPRHERRVQSRGRQAGGVRDLRASSRGKIMDNSIT